ncbi:BfmA/BtgA family mobilization protein [Flavivirga algicola]|uniref:Uncharacterized protein n=1 Tax=Flavivirga algicola TaxID=2729136 RepID=A0ABX1S1X5_9FLAO|nr:BfmA/BtgA family mobilization protein [Flavivirga algicola]NMH89880.1 hypothetical protein [Flavivirga algicola]
MDKGREKEAFVTIKIKTTIANKYRIFCKHNGVSQSMCLLQMIQFFEFNGLAPTDHLGDSFAKLEGKINKRTNAIIAIIKDIEKSQTLPTVAMLQSLFDQQIKQESNDFEEDFEFVERKFANDQNQKEFDMETTVPRIRYERLEDKMNSVKSDFEYVLDKVKPVKSNFGKDYLKLELTIEELVKFRRILKNT